MTNIEISTEVLVLILYFLRRKIKNNIILAETHKLTQVSPLLTLYGNLGAFLLTLHGNFGALNF